MQRAHRTDADPHLKLGEFDWLADHHLDGYLEALPGCCREFRGGGIREYAGIELDAVPLHYIDEPAEQVVRGRRCSTRPSEPARGQSRKANWRRRSSSSRSGGQ